MKMRARVGLTSILFVVSVAWSAGCVTEPEVRPPCCASPGDTTITVPDTVTDEPTGQIEVRTFTWGRRADPDGYLFSIDGGAGRSISTSDSVTVEGLVPGDHEVALRDVAAECLVEGSNPRVVTVGLGTSSTSFRVDCSGPDLTLAIVSGEDQAGRPGEVLAEPLVVRVADASGRGVAGVEVDWGITAGEGTLANSFTEDAGPLWSAITHTDDEGLAEVPLMPLGFEIVEVTAHVYALDLSPVTFLVDAADARASLGVFSGNDQAAYPGRELDEPLVVRLTDGRGEPVSHVRLLWRVVSGDGYLGTGGSGVGPQGDTTRTDADGLARVSLTPTWLGPVEVSASANGVNDSPVTFRTDATALGASLGIVSGDGQSGKTAEVLSEPFVVVATDGLGNPIPNVLVTWSIAQGAGTFGDYWAEWIWRQDWAGYTDEQGLARATFSPGSLGTMSVEASLYGSGSTSTFTTEVDVLVIHYYAYDGGPSFDDVTCTEWTYYACAESAIPLGTKVEWVNHLSQVRIVSTSRPLDGATFDSGVLAQDERFEFIPRVVGTWEYVALERGVVASRLRVY